MDAERLGGMAPATLPVTNFAGTRLRDDARPDAAWREELRRIALKNGFAFVKHLTHRPAAETLLTLAALIGGNAA